MNATNNSLVDGCGVENSKEELNRLKKQIEETTNLSKYPHFRGKPIEWITENKYSIKTTPNAIDANTPDEDEVFRGKRHLISYEGQIYTREQFLMAMFTEYKKYQYKVRFNNDDVFYLNSNQRAKLQYHILAQNFDLVKLDEQDKTDLYFLCLKHDGETAQRWLNRMLWEDGHEKMITFGVALDVRSAKDKDGNITSKTKSVWCYRVQMDDNTATYKGVSMTWEEWKRRIVNHVELIHDLIKLWCGDKAKEFDNVGINQCIGKLFFQDGMYLTLPYEENTKLIEWLVKYFKGEKAVFPYSGNMPLADLEFTIDFKKDIEIVKAYDLKNPSQMAEYNREHNDKHNKEMGENMVKQTFSRLVGDEWTTQEIYSQGFNKGNLERFVKYGLIKRIKRGHYIRVCK